MISLTCFAAPRWAAFIPTIVASILVLLAAALTAPEAARAASVRCDRLSAEHQGRCSRVASTARVRCSTVPGARRKAACLRKRTKARQELAAYSRMAAPPAPSPAAPAPAPAAPTVVPVGGSAGAAAADIALRYLGVPYLYGGSTPAGFDCSGLTQFAFAHVGRQLPRTTQAQFTAGTSIPLEQAAKGDLVFAYRLGHVGIYLGNGQYVHAPRSGTAVRMAALPAPSEIDGVVRIA